MSVRKISARLGMAAVAVSGLALTALAPANADTMPGQTSGTTPSAPPSSAWAPTPSSGWTTRSRPTTSTRPADPHAVTGPTSTPASATTPAAPGSATTPTAPGFPCGADNTGHQGRRQARREASSDPARPAASLPSGSGDGRTLLRTPDRPAVQRRGLRALVRPDQHHRPRRRRDRASVRGRQDRRGDAPGRSGPGLADRSADPQDLQRHLHQLEPGRRQERHDPPLPAEGRLEHAERVRWRSSRRWTASTRPRAPTTTPPRTRPPRRSGRARPGATITDGNWNTGSDGRPDAANVEEHDPSVIIADPKAIEPFSYGRAQLANGDLADRAHRGRLVRGPRAVPRRARARTSAGAGDDAVRATAATAGVLENLFSNTGWVCTNATAPGRHRRRRLLAAAARHDHRQLRCEERQHPGHHQPVRLHRRGRGCRHHHERLLLRRRGPRHA